jgi:hypothetical protein
MDWHYEPRSRATGYLGYGCNRQQRQFKCVDFVSQNNVGFSFYSRCFSPVTINVNVQGVKYQEIHVDGGTTNQAFIYPGQLSVKNSRRRAVVKADRRIYIIRNGKVRPEWKKVKGQTLSIAERAVDTLLTSQGDSDMYKIFAITKLDGFDFNLAYVPLDFDFPSNELFDKTYMNALFDLAYAEGVKGIRWRKNPYGF